GYYDNGGSRAYIVRIARQADLDLFSEKNGSAKALVGGSRAEATFGGITVRALGTGKSGNDIEVEIAHVGDGDGFTMKVTDGDKTETFGTAKAPLEPGNLSAVKSRIVEASSTAAATKPDAKTFKLSGGLDGSPSGTLPAVLPLQAELANVTPEEFVGDDA